jgi:hypothetical protein
MRVTRTTDGLNVHAVAGTYVVMFGIDLPAADCQRLLGFSFHRIDHEGNTARYLEGMKALAETDPGFPAGADYPADRHPVSPEGGAAEDTELEEGEVIEALARSSRSGITDPAEQQGITDAYVCRFLDCFRSHAWRRTSWRRSWTGGSPGN